MTKLSYYLNEIGLPEFWCSDCLAMCEFYNCGGHNITGIITFELYCDKCGKTIVFNREYYCDIFTELCNIMNDDPKVPTLVEHINTFKIL